MLSKLAQKLCSSSKEKKYFVLLFGLSESVSCLESLKNGLCYEMSCRAKLSRTKRGRLVLASFLLQMCLCCDLQAEALMALFLTSGFNLLASSAINGFVFGNLPALTMCAGDHVAWHLFGMGNEIDIHTAYFHGETLSIRGHRTDVASLFPATFVTADMIPGNPGRWLLSCQLNDHIQGKTEAGICSALRGFPFLLPASITVPITGLVMYSVMGTCALGSIPTTNVRS